MRISRAATPAANVLYRRVVVHGAGRRLGVEAFGHSVAVAIAAASMQVRIWLVSRPPPMASSAMVAPVALSAAVRSSGTTRPSSCRRARLPPPAGVPRAVSIARCSRARCGPRGASCRRGRARRLGSGSRLRPSLSSEDEPPRPRTLSKGCRHAVSRLLARRGARVGVALCPSRRWLRTPQAWWPSRATRTRTPGGIVSSCLGSRIAERLSAPVLGCPTEGPPSVAEGGKATS